MLLLQAFLKFSSIGAMLALGVLILRDGRHIRALQFALPLLATLISLFLTTGHSDITVTSWPAIPLRLFDMLSFVFVWWFGLALFDDEFKLGLIEWVGCVAFIIVQGLSRLHFLGLLDWSYPPLEFIAAAMTLVMMAHLAYVAIAGLQEDLIENRRTMRKYFASAILVLTSASILIERLAGNVGVDPFASIYVVYIFTLPLTLWAMVWLTKLDPERLAFPSKEIEVPESTADPRNDQARQRLVAIMENELAYSEHGLTIGKLSERIDLPPHQLRTLINQSMGYRNYTAFLNHYRIKAVKADLANPEKSRVPILTLAIEAGFSSLAPFNRAFKDSEDITPTDYRSQELQKSSSIKPEA